MRAVMLLMTATLLRVCGGEQTTASAPNSVTPRAELVPEHRGVVATSGGLSVEVAPLTNGRIAAYLRDPAAQPIENARVQLNVRKPDGTTEVVVASWDPAEHAYVGVVTGVSPGNYPIEVQATPAGAAAPVRIETAPVTIAATATAPTPRHGGRVQMMGNAAVELVTAPNGQVEMYWMAPDGTPIQPTAVEVPSVQVTVAGQPQTVPVRVEGDHFVGTVRGDLEPGARVSVEIPTVRVQGVVYTAVAVPEVVVVPTIVVARPAVQVVRPTTVVVEEPAVHVVAPVVAVQPPSVVFGVGIGVGVGVGHAPRGRAHGWWGHRGRH